MFNKVILIGNLTADPELRYTAQGTPVATFRLAVNSRFKTGDEKKEEVLFIPVVVFGKQAEPCSQYLTKGRPALVEGRLREKKWEHEGQQKSRVEVMAASVRFIGKKDETAPPAQEPPPPEDAAGDEPF